MNLAYFKSNSAVNMNLNARRIFTAIGKSVRAAKAFPTQYSISPVNSARASWPSTITKDAQTLIVQDQNNNITIFKVLADNKFPGAGSYVMEKVFISAASPVAVLDAITLGANIVGPIEPSDSINGISGTPLPRCFSALQKLSSEIPAQTSTPGINQNSFPEFDISGLYAVEGIGLKLEMLDTENQNSKNTPASQAIRGEFYKRISN